MGAISLFLNDWFEDMNLLGTGNLRGTLRGVGILPQEISDRLSFSGFRVEAPRAVPPRLNRKG